MTNPNPPDPTIPDACRRSRWRERPGLRLVFNANDPSGAGGLAGDVTAIASVGAHACRRHRRLRARHREILDHFRLRRGGRGRAGAHHPGRRAGAGDQGRLCRQRREPQHHCRDRRRLCRRAADRLHAQPVLVETKCRSTCTWTPFASCCCRRPRCWLETTARCGAGCCPTGAATAAPAARDIAKRGLMMGVPYTLVTGIPAARPVHRQRAGHAPGRAVQRKVRALRCRVLGRRRHLSAALAALLASGSDLAERRQRSPELPGPLPGRGLRPGMGTSMPDRLFWAQPEPATKMTDQIHRPAGFDCPP
jgi:hydroxymethylpyrimidine/phosphomethylpyrimidine kinase